MKKLHVAALTNRLHPWHSRQTEKKKKEKKKGDIFFSKPARRTNALSCRLTYIAALSSAQKAVRVPAHR